MSEIDVVPWDGTVLLLNCPGVKEYIDAAISKTDLIKCLIQERALMGDNISDGILPKMRKHRPKITQHFILENLSGKLMMKITVYTNNINDNCLLYGI